MHVAIDCRYLHGQPSGIGSYVRALIDRLPADRGMDFVLWADPRARRPLTAAANARDWVVRSGPNSPLSLLWPGWAADLGGLDLLHLTNSVLPRGVSCPTVVTVHDVLALDEPRLNRPGIERVRGLYYPQAVMRALRRATRIVVPSRATADRVVAWAPEAADRTHVIPLAASSVFGRPADPGAAAARARTLVGGEYEYVLAVGETTANKGHATAVDAFAAVAPKSWRLVVLERRGSPRALRQAAARAGVPDRVVRLSDISDEDVAVLMQRASLLVQPSRYEGFGLPVVEAMACGCPVVASDIPALREVSGGAAILVAPGDVAALAAAVRRLIESPAERQALADHGLMRAADFSWDRTARQTWTVYEDAARG